jgi:hypothetical protein
MAKTNSTPPADRAFATFMGETLKPVPLGYCDDELEDPKVGSMDDLSDDFLLAALMHMLPRDLRIGKPGNVIAHLRYRVERRGRELY